MGAGIAAENHYDGLAVERVWLSHIEIKRLVLMLAVEATTLLRGEPGAERVSEGESDAVVYAPLSASSRLKGMKNFIRSLARVQPSMLPCFRSHRAGPPPHTGAEASGPAAVSRQT
jgi:hypothetical protein